MAEETKTEVAATEEPAKDAKKAKRARRSGRSSWASSPWCWLPQARAFFVWHEQPSFLQRHLPYADGCIRRDLRRRQQG